MRVVWVSHFPVFGGQHNLVLQLAAPLAQRGWNSSAALPVNAGTAADRLRGGGVEVTQLPLGRVRASANPGRHLRWASGFRGDIRRLRSLFREQRSDAVVLTGLTNTQAAFAAGAEGVPLVWQIVDSRNPAPLRVAAMGVVRRRADAVMFDGNALRRLHAGGRELGMPSFLFTPVVDLKRFRADPEHRAEARRLLRVPPDAFFAGTVANVNPQKGIEYFVRAAARVFRERPDAYFLISGATYPNHRSYTEAIHREIAATGVPPERWLFRKEPPDMHYPALDVKLITSVPRSEGTTTTAMESFACGTPVVATEVGAVAEVVEDGVTGLVVPPLDPEALAAATLKLARDADLRVEMAARCRRRAAELYGLERGAEVHVRALEAAIEHARGRTRR